MRQPYVFSWPAYETAVTCSIPGYAHGTRGLTCQCAAAVMVAYHTRKFIRSTGRFYGIRILILFF